MNNEFNGLEFEDNDIGMTVPGNTSFKLSDSKFRNNGIGLQIRDPESVNARLGLPADTPKEVLLEAIGLLKSAHEDGAPDKKAVLSDSKLWTYIERLSNASSVASNLISVTGSNAVIALLSDLAKS